MKSQISAANRNYNLQITNYNYKLQITIYKLHDDDYVVIVFNNFFMGDSMNFFKDDIYDLKTIIKKW